VPRLALLACGLLCACPPPAPAVIPLTLTVGTDGTFSVSRADAGVQGLQASVTVSGVELTGDAPTITTSGGVTTVERTAGSTRLVLTLTPSERFVTARLTASCTSSCPGARVEGFTIAGQFSGGTPTAALSNGYSSWAPTYWATVQRTADPAPADELVGNNENALSSDARLSWWVSALTAPGATVVAGALTAEAWKSRVLTWRNAAVQLRLRSGGGGDSLPLTADGVSSETYLFTVGATPQDALRTWADQVAVANPPPEVPFVPVGWNSWNTLFENVTEANALANADRLGSLGFEANNLQLDDGWEQAWGTWTANAKFPSGLGGVAATLGGKQLHAGVWMAPFFVDTTTPVANNLDWFVRDSRGRLISYDDAFTHRSYNAIDPTHPAARAWMVGQVKQRLDEGYRYLKLDFLYAGAYEGVRHDDVTSLQAFRLARKEIAAQAKAAGAYVVACGAPVLPSAGVAHALRTSNDIAARGTPYTFTWVKNVSRNVGARWFVNPFLANDPDTILIRGLPDGEKRLQVTTALLAGRLLGLGDDLTAMPADEAAFLEAAAKLPAIARVAAPGPGFVPLDGAATPRGTSLSQAEALVDAESYAVPSVWAAAATSQGALVGLFNWSSAEQTLSVDAASLGLKGTEQATELWTGKAVAPASGRWSVAVPPHDAAYLRVK